jgi:glycosyltransferase involved in cell wall biosynthesis
MKVLHAIHDFLPRHQAGSEIYALNICQAQRAAGLDARVLCTDDDVALEHGSIRRREYEGVPIVEVINNWTFDSFRDSYRSPVLNRQLRAVLEAERPDILHIHNLLNLTFDVPAIARELGIPTVATLHDYTLICASGGQRVHRSEEHVCAVIDPRRCSRCFTEHNFFERARFGPAPEPVHVTPIQRLRGLMRRQAGAAPVQAKPPIPASQIEERLEAVKEVFASTDLFIAPSPNLGTEYRRLGLPEEKLLVSDYGFVRPRIVPRTARTSRLRVGFVGTLVWHKGMHVLLEAIRQLPQDRVELKVYGNPKEFPDYSAALKAQARGLPVRFMGRFERDAVGEVYANLDVLVVPSLWPENSPLVIHEAFMAGLPVVGSRQGGTQDLVSDGTNGFLYEAFDARELAAVLQRFIDDPALVDRLSANAPAVKSIEDDARDLIAIYRRLRRRHASAAAPSAMALS